MSETTVPIKGPEVAPEVDGGRHAVPVWLFLSFFMLLYWGMVYFDQHSGWLAPQVYAPYHSIEELQRWQPVSGPGEQGKRVYEAVCALCHNPDGAGKPGQAPPFIKSELAVGNPNRMIRIPLNGLSGPVKVAGTDWNLSMPAMGAALSDDDLAAVLTYIRTSWGNNGSEISPEQVKKVRSDLGNRSQPWSIAELETVQ